MTGSSTATNPLTPFLDRQGFVVLDGGLATELERRGCDLRDELWSAKVLMEQPGIIQDVHRDFLEAGSDCIASASYQANIPAFTRRGLTPAEARGLLLRSVELAVEARDEFWAVPENQRGRMRPLVAASIGPYGAYLADGSEYTGQYDLDREGLIAFHRERWDVLAGSGADLMACETIPSAPEVLALCGLLRETADVPGWVSFSCRDGKHLADGTPLSQVVRDVEGEPLAVAVGVNCVSPRLVPELIAEIRRATTKPVAAYPNSGEAWDATRKCWVGSGVAGGVGAAARTWYAAGARLIGGCCRTGPEDVRAVREGLGTKGQG